MKSKRTIFQDIIEGIIPAEVIYEDDLTLVFLDHNPVTEGHALVVPKEPIDHLDACSPELYQAIFNTVHKTSRMLKASLGPERIGLVVHGYEVPHAHVHVLPVYKRGDLKLPKRPERVASKGELAKVAKKIKVRS